MSAIAADDKDGSGARLAKLVQRATPKLRYSRRVGPRVIYS
jgi:hypothetical protein